MRYAVVTGPGPVRGVCEFPTLTVQAVSQMSSEGTTYVPIPSDILMPAVDIMEQFMHVGGGTLKFVGKPPNLFSMYDLVVDAWITDLQAAKAFFGEAEKTKRNEVEFSPFTYNGMTFDGDLDAQRRLSVLVSAAKSAIAAGYSFTKDFTLADNTVVQLTAEDFIGIEMAKLWQVDVAFQEYRLKKAAIEAAATLEELEAITI